MVLLCAGANAQEEKAERLDSVIVSASRAGKNTPVTYDNVGKDVLKASNPMASLPMALNTLPSVVTYNEGGTGLGNSAMTIRGSKGSQINVTLNGITLNDAESQEVFWVNIPALTSLISNVQVQRGLGTTANGAGAFGASINMNTAFVTPEPHASAEYSFGSYNTFLTTVHGSTGINKRGFYGSVAYSRGSTDGYIRNGFVQSESAFLTLGWLGVGQSLRFTYLMGRQRSGITWDGIDLEQYAKDRTYNYAGEYYDDKGNVHYYDNQTDNYAQHHLQLNYTRTLKRSLAWTTTLNYTRGDGYDEYYFCDNPLSDIGLASAAVSDITCRKQMGNDYLVLNSDLRFKSQVLDVTGGINLSHYHGDHWGDVLWIKELGDDFDASSADWYRNYAYKEEAGAFVRAEYRPLHNLTAYADIQYRGVKYFISGKDEDWWAKGASPADIMAYDRSWHFFNPRAGITWADGPSKLYASLAFGNREPGRGDIKENIKGSGADIVPEKMMDLEAGYAYSRERLAASVNLYCMEYRDMLLETGRLSSSGYAIKENVPRAWRRGIETALSAKPLKWLRADANLTLSINEIDDYTAYVPYDDYSDTYPVHYGRTVMLLSPSVIGMGQITASPLRGFSVSGTIKYVGNQYLDNSMRDGLSVPAYSVVDIAFSKIFEIQGAVLNVSAHIGNLLDREYYASGWRWESYSPSSDSITYGVGIYPQATRNIMVKTSLTF